MIDGLLYKAFTVLNERSAPNSAPITILVSNASDLSDIRIDEANGYCLQFPKGLREIGILIKYLLASGYLSSEIPLIYLDDDHVTYLTTTFRREHQGTTFVTEPSELFGILAEYVREFPDKKLPILFLDNQLTSNSMNGLTGRQLSKIIYAVFNYPNNEPQRLEKALQDILPAETVLNYLCGKEDSDPNHNILSHLEFLAITLDESFAQEN